MKCMDCPDYKACRRQNDLRRKRYKCKKANEPFVHTNADRIRAMSDEELADKFTDVAYEAHGRWYEPDGMTYHSQSADAKKAWLDWLRKPVKDGDNDGGNV